MEHLVIFARISICRNPHLSTVRPRNPAMRCCLNSSMQTCLTFWGESVVQGKRGILSSIFGAVRSKEEPGKKSVDCLPFGRWDEHQHPHQHFHQHHHPHLHQHGAHRQHRCQQPAPQQGRAPPIAAASGKSRLHWKPETLRRLRRLCGDLCHNFDFALIQIFNQSWKVQKPYEPPALGKSSRITPVGSEEVFGATENIFPAELPFSRWPLCPPAKVQTPLAASRTVLRFSSFSLTSSSSTLCRC